MAFLCSVNKVETCGWKISQCRISDCHTLLDSVTDSKVLMSVHMRFLSVPHAVNVFRVR